MIDFMHRSLSIKVLKKSTNNVTIKLLAGNSQMRIPKSDFEKRIKSGLYLVKE